MTDAPEPAPPGSDRSGSDRPEPVLPERLRRRLDAVFGDVLPDVTRDEAPDRDPADPGPVEHRSARDGRGAPAAGSADAADPSRQDAWLRENRPPHHDQD